MRYWLAAFLLALVGCTSNVEDPVSEQDELSYNWQLLHIFYLYQDEIQPLSAYVGTGSDTLDWGDVLAMYDGLNDPYTHYFPPAIASQVLNSYVSSGTANGLMGIQVRQLTQEDTTAPDTLVIHRVYPGSPAEAKGMKKGDKILEVKGNDVTGPLGDSLFFVYSKGDSGAVIDLKLMRGDSIFSVSVMKSVFDIPTVYLDSVDGVPVIQITEFAAYSLGDSGTAAEMHTVMQGVAGAPAVVVDVRGNPGGSVDECLDVADQFVGNGNLIVEITREYDENSGDGYFDTTDYPALMGQSGESQYLVAMADSGSASCSEIFLAAVTANRGTKIVGTQSFGKGIGQNLFPTAAEGLAVVTSLQFRDADMLNYHGEGIPADYSTGSAESDLALAVRLAAGLGDTTAVALSGSGVGLARSSGALGWSASAWAAKVETLEGNLERNRVKKAPMAFRLR